MIVTRLAVVAMASRGEYYIILEVIKKQKAKSPKGAQTWLHPSTDHNGNAMFTSWYVLRHAESH